MSTVRVFRIVHRRYADEPFSGKGGLYAASRWANRGRLVSYAAGSLALATLEKITGAGSLDRLGEMVYADAHVDEDAVWHPSDDDLPSGWNRRPSGTASRAFGDRWLGEQTSVVLCVPSVVVPESWNYVINPSHSSVDEVLTSGETRPLDLGPRVIDQLRTGPA